MEQASWKPAARGGFQRLGKILEALLDDRGCQSGWGWVQLHTHTCRRRVGAVTLGF